MSEHGVHPKVRVCHLDERRLQRECGEDAAGCRGAIRKQGDRVALLFAGRRAGPVGFAQLAEPRRPRRLQLLGGGDQRRCKAGGAEQFGGGQHGNAIAPESGQHPGCRAARGRGAEPVIERRPAMDHVAPGEIRPRYGLEESLPEVSRPHVAPPLRAFEWIISEMRPRCKCRCTHWREFPAREVPGETAESPAGPGVNKRLAVLSRTAAATSGGARDTPPVYLLAPCTMLCAR